MPANLMFYQDMAFYYATHLVYIIFISLLENGSLRATLERGLCRAVSGDNPTSPIVTFDLLRDRCACSMQALADILKAAKSAHALSRVTTLLVHLEQM